MLAFYLSMLENEKERLTFSQIYEDLRLPCLHVALAITKNQEIAEDALHNAFLAVIKHKDELFSLPCGKRRSRIVIIVKNKAIDIMRMENRRSERPFDDMASETLTDDFDISEIIESRDGFERLVQSVSMLPEIYKTTFELRYVHEKSNPEIADLLDISPKAVSMRIARAKLMLQDILNKEGVANG